jgi:hypothetical protein
LAALAFALKLIRLKAAWSTVDAEFGAALDRVDCRLGIEGEACMFRTDPLSGGRAGNAGKGGFFFNPIGNGFSRAPVDLSLGKPLPGVHSSRQDMVVQADSAPAVVGREDIEL